MESDELCKVQVRKVAQDVLKFMWFTHGLLSPEKLRQPELSFIPDITSEFVYNLFILVRIETYQNEYIWEKFLINHFKSMTKTPYMFANYFAYASYLLSAKAENAYLCFMNILSLVIHFTHFCWRETEDFNYIKSCLDLFCAFFDKELCKKFEYQGMWKDFEKYLKKYGESRLKRYAEASQKNKSLSDVFTEFQSRNETEEPYIINGTILEKITTHEVENDKKAVGFAEFVKNKMKEACGKTFDEMLNDFQKTENELEKMYRKTACIDSSDVANAEVQSTSQEIQESLEKVHNKDNDQSKEIEAHKPLKEVLKDFKKTENQEDTIEVASKEMENNEKQYFSQEIQDEALENNPNNALKEVKASDPLDSCPAPKEFIQIPEITQKDIEEAKRLLKEILVDISKIQALLKFLYAD